MTAYHGLTAALEACGGEEAAEALCKNIAGNLEFLLYREIARLLDDSNMLVFHNNESFASWIRAQATRNGDQSFLDAGAPAILRLKTGRGTAFRILDDAKTKEDADRWGTTGRGRHDNLLSGQPHQSAREVLRPGHRSLAAAPLCHRPGRAFRPAPIFAREMARFRVQKERSRREPIPVSRAGIRC